MALSRITQGGAGSFNSGYAIGDLIIILAANLANSTVPSTPSGYSSLTSAQQSSDNCAMAIFYKYATSTSESYPSITNATDSVYEIWTGIHPTAPFTQTGGQSSAAGGSSTISYSGIGTYGDAGVDVTLTFAVSTVNGAAMASKLPNNMRLVTNSSNYLALFESYGPLISYAFNSKTLDASSVWMTKTTELVAADSTYAVGKLTNGASETTSSTDRKKVSSASPTYNGKAKSITIRGRITSENTTLKGVIYSDSGGAPSALLATSDEITIDSTTEFEWTAPLSGANQINLAAGTTYWIGFLQKDPGTGSFAISRDGTSNASQTNTDTYADGASDPFGTPTLEAGPIDAYVTYDRFYSPIYSRSRRNVLLRR